MSYTRPNLTQEEILEVLVLHQLGIKMTTIGLAYGITSAAVAYHIRPYKFMPAQTDLRKLAKRLLASELQDAAPVMVPSTNEEMLNAA